MKHFKATILFAVVSVLALAAAAQASSCDRAIVEKMMTMYNLDKGLHEIEILSNPLKTAGVSVDNIAIRPLTQKEPLGLFTVMVKVIEEGEAVESGQVRMRIHRFADVVVLSDRIRSRKPLSHEKLTLKRMDVTSLREKPLTSIDNLDGYRAKRNLKKGTVLTTSAIELTPDIESGREVSIVYVDGLCRVTAAGVALQSGLAGEYVKVRNRVSGKIVVARVVDETAVTVDP
jgi:flagella basal body P-ring formation protein FlgA